jgi:NAD(P)-dependent dehydrogenase (short-subunit alcohol dehydrogenase family)
LNGHVAIVTGAAQGIGECIARDLASDGARILLSDIQEDKVASVASSLRDEGMQAESIGIDITDPLQAEEMVARALEVFGQVDSLVNNAGIDAPPGRAWEIGESHWREVIDVNLSGAWWCTRAVLPHMRKRQCGRIVMISSISARMASPETSPAYSAAKAGLIGLTISLSVQLEGQGILVNAITPGATGSTGTPLSEAERNLYSFVLPLGTGGPQPTAETVRFLLRPSGDWISGAIFNISGGALRGM